MVRSRISRGSKDNKGRPRKYIQIPDLYYDEYNFGDVVDVKKVQQESW